MSTMALVAGDSVDTGGALPHAVHYGLIAIGVVAVCVVGVAHLRGRHGGEASPAGRTATEDRALPVAERLVVPLALVSSAAAAGVHAAVGPPHFRESVLFGLFFALTAVLQLAWAGLLVVRRSRALLVLGALGNVAVLAVWAVTRTVGLPFGLLPDPEAVGPWDLACGVWELVVVASCVVLLRTSHPRGEIASWQQWHRSVRVYAGGSVLLLAALAFSGAAS